MLMAMVTHMEAVVASIPKLFHTNHVPGARDREKSDTVLLLLNCALNYVLEKTSESPLDCKEIQPVNPKGNQSWIFIGRTDAEAEIPILWPPDAKNWLIGKDPDAGKDWRREEKGTTEDEMVGWRHQLDGHEFDQTPGVGDGQESLACCQSMGSQRMGHDWTTELTGVVHFSRDLIAPHNHLSIKISLLSYWEV